MSRDIKCYYMPRILSQYGGAFIVEELPDQQGSIFFIEKPDWCKPFESISPNPGKIEPIFNIMVRDKLYCSIDGIIANNILYQSAARANEYKELESKLSDIQVEIEHAMHEDRWMEWMQDHVESLESLKARGIDLEDKEGCK